MASYCSYNLVALVNCRRMSVICDQVLPVATIGSGPGLAGGTKSTRLSVFYITGLMVR